MNSPAAKIKVLGIPVTPGCIGDVAQLLDNKNTDESMIITFVNPQACALDQQYADYAALLEDFDIVACDGIGMVAAAKSSGVPGIKRESFDFTSLAEGVFGWAARNGREIGLVGGQVSVPEQAATTLRQKFPELKFSACFSGFGTGPIEAAKFFAENQTELIICGMGGSMQERFLLQLVAAGWCGTGFTCGGFMDQLIAGEAYYPVWIDRLNMRFLYRLFKEPRRLRHRYLVDYRVFLNRYRRLQWQRLKSKVGFGSATDKME